MKRNILGFTLFILGLSANAEQKINNIELPNGYETQYLDPIRKQAYFIDDTQVKGKPSIIFSFVSDTTKKEDIWFTTCQHTFDKGLQIFTCFTQQGQFGIGSSADGHDVVFRFEKPKEIVITQINYKIDNKKIMTFPVSAIPRGMAAETFIRQLKEASVLSFSWKDGSQYKAEKINLNGLAESLLFAKKMIELNN
ncbi:hypothetical protein [Acinetobacter soli]|uniref:DUF4468 domain-containing protein n=1 Tax=Acinetobacter soli NIPH 2899 TaxID=1217677 RepID=A0ABP2U887_9GAMM|nr:hypothetical protein [Acinetobacter soli]ENV60983.1 hypothetical protein F950_00228 [Acinetobacter soli NIPH 2899]